MMLYDEPDDADVLAVTSEPRKRRDPPSAAAAQTGGETGRETGTPALNVRSPTASSVWSGFELPLLGFHRSHDEHCVALRTSSTTA